LIAFKVKGKSKLSKGRSILPSKIALIGDTIYLSNVAGTLSQMRKITIIEKEDKKEKKFNEGVEDSCPYSFVFSDCKEEFKKIPVKKEALDSI
jgi:hypothetical protein